MPVLRNPGVATASYMSFFNAVLYSNLNNCFSAGPVTSNFKLNYRKNTSNKVVRVTQTY